MLMMLNDGSCVNKAAIKYISDYREPPLTLQDIANLGRKPEFEATIHFIDGTTLDTSEDVEELADLFGLGMDLDAHALEQINSTLMRAFGNDGYIASIDTGIDGIYRMLGQISERMPD